ncbi:MAG: type III-A CRISPR-associated RAMP protein Csm4 [Deltaproteobacteria bacterium]|nr:type III-A CRISPR-associated RAMP protein Csm4 [Deltaproteobacteria bacterium]
MELYAYCLHFSGPVRFGATGIGLEETDLTLDSDGLTSAFLNALAVKEGPEAVAEFIRQVLAGNPPVIFSSLFPFGPDPLDHSQTAYVLPKPLSGPPTAPETLRDFGKDLKKLNWLRPQDAARWLASGSLTAEELQGILERSRDLARSREDDPESGWFAEELRPRVALDRSHSGSALWACAALRFAPGAGLYGLVALTQQWRETWLDTLHLLGGLGLGGERTYGFGEFVVSGPNPLGDEWESLLTAPRERFLLLSAYFPAPEERPRLADCLEAWNFVERRGFIVTGRRATTLKRKRVRLLVPGSVLRRPLKGAYADVTPEDYQALGLAHRVYRCGLAFTLPFYPG